jgi:hypothetical protein
MGEPIPSNVGISIAEYIGNRGERGELKHLSTLRKRKQYSDSQSSGERNGKSLNRIYGKVCRRCMFGVAGSYQTKLQVCRQVINSIDSRIRWKAEPQIVKV